MMLKKSLYNVAVRREDGWIVYNTLYNSLIRLSDSEYTAYHSVEKTTAKLVECLCENGFWVDAEIDEYKRYEFLRRKALPYFSGTYQFTVALTTKCNAKCVYCYQENAKQYDMTVRCAERIAELICCSKKLKSAVFTWFGGEPLLKPELIDCITDRLRYEKIAYSGGIVTNGSLLTKQLIKERFLKWNINYVQITLDGTDQEYLKRKRYSGSAGNIFWKVLDNIALLLHYGVYVYIRLNIDKNNEDNILNVAEILNERFQDESRLMIYPAFLTGIDNCIETEEHRVYIAEAIQKRISGIGKDAVKELLESPPKLNACILDRPHAYTIDADGSILYCERDIGKQQKSLNVFDIDSFDGKDTGVCVLSYSRCKTCIYYPKCLGGCMSCASSGYDACFIERYLIEAYLKHC